MKFLIACLVFSICGGHSALADVVTPKDVFQRLSFVAAQVDLVRLEMGVADVTKPDLAITGAQPREVYFQALTLFQKTDRLLFQLLRERADSPSAEREEITSESVLNLVELAAQNLFRIMQYLNIAEVAMTQALQGTPSPTTVYLQIIRVNRVLNTLLQQRFSPSEVYQQVTYGVGLASSVLKSLPIRNSLGRENAFIHRKTPADVYRKLISIYMLIHETMLVSGEKCLVIEANEADREDVTPSDVFDLATLLVSELSFLHDRAPNTKDPNDSYYPGDKLPSHVFQRASRLHSQIETLRIYVSNNPDWLRDK